MKNVNMGRKMENDSRNNNAIGINNGSFPSIYESELKKNDSKDENTLTSRFFSHIGRLPTICEKAFSSGLDS